MVTIEPHGVSYHITATFTLERTKNKKEKVKSREKKIEEMEKNINVNI
jgi:hypothetical protein